MIPPDFRQMAHEFCQENSQCVSETTIQVVELAIRRGYETACDAAAASVSAATDDLVKARSKNLSL